MSPACSPRPIWPRRAYSTRILTTAFCVLTDLGRIGYLDALNADLSLADTLMRPVLDVLVAVAAVVHGRAPCRPMTRPCCAASSISFPEWFVGRHLGYQLSDDGNRHARPDLQVPDQLALAQPKVFIHRDFMPRNLMVVESAETLTPGIIDFQDAV